MAENISMNRELLISFVIPVYNSKDYIADCIYSIINQDIDKSIYEIICVDDCSTDGSYDLLKELEKEISCLKIIQNSKNSGVSYTRNYGLSNSHGKYVRFVDSDDLIYPGCLKKSIELLNENEPDVLVGNYIKVPENTKLYENFEVKEFNTTYSCYEKVFDAAPIEINDNKPMLSTTMSFFNRDFLNKGNIKYDENIPISEELDFYLAFPKSCRIIKMNAICYLYRYREGSLVNSKKRYKRGYEAASYILEKYISKNGVYSDKNKEEKKNFTDTVAVMKHNIANSLVLVDDYTYVKEQLRILEQKGFYPYPFNISALKTNRQPLYKRLALFLLPIKPIFLLVNKVFTKK